MVNPLRIFRKKHLYTLTRHFWGVVFTAIIALAIVVQLGRQAFPLINDYREIIAQKLGERLGVVISVDSIDASWSGLKPKITLNGLSVRSVEDEEIFTVSEATAELSLIDSLVRKNLSWRRIIFNNFDTRLVQTDLSRWHINGYRGSKKNDQAITIDDPFDVFVFGRRVEINEANIALQFYSGLESVISVPKINLENDRFFHRMTVDVTLDENEKAFEFVLEGYGDPRRQDEFSARGYLHLKNFSTERVVAAVAGNLWEGKDDARWRDEQKIDVELWFQGSSLHGINFVGGISSDGLPIKLPQDFILPSGLRSNIAGYLHPELGWKADFSHIDLTWLERSAPISELSLFGSLREMTLTTPSIDITAWRDLLVDAGLNKLPKINEAIAELSPEGYLNDVSVQLKSKKDGYFLATAKLKEGGVNAYLGSPGIKNINGDVEASLLHGAIDLETTDGFSFSLPKLYENPLTFMQASGVVDWRLDFEKRHAYINSGLLSVKNSDESAHGYLNLDLPFAKEWGEVWMNLMIGIDESQATYHKKYIPSVVDQGLCEWLDGAIKSGKVRNGQFLYSGSLDADPREQPAILVHGFFDNTSLKFDPDWPSVTKASGFFSVENTSFSGEVYSAEFNKAVINNANIVLEPSVNDKPPAIRIIGDAQTRAEDIKALLFSSPIKDQLPSAIASWVLHGDVAAHVDIQVPIESSEDGSLDIAYDFDMELQSVDVDMTTLRLPIKAVQGKINYSSKNLLTAKTLKSKLWGEPFTANISSDHFDENNDRYMHVNTQGNIAVTDLEEWTKRPELHFLDGKFMLDGQTIVPLTASARHPLRVNFTSDLVGTAINLPIPFMKSKKVAQALSGSVAVDDESETYRITLADKLHVVANMETNKQAAVSVLFNDRASQNIALTPVVNPVDTGVVSLKGHLEDAEFSQWQDVIAQYTQYQQAVQASEAILASEDNVQAIEPTANDEYLVVLDAGVDLLKIGDLEIPNFNVTGRSTDDAWLFDIKSPMAAGTVILSDDDIPPSVDLSYLKIEADSEPHTNVDGNTESSSVFSDIEFSDIPELSIAIEDVSINNTDYGRWAFDLKPSDTRVEINNIVGLIHGLQVGFKKEPANMLWTRRKTRNRTTFSGKLRSKDISDVLLGFELSAEQEKILTSSSADFETKVRWQGAPDEFALTLLRGKVDFILKDGSFIKGASAGENPLLRLIALLNFDTLARRLKLDFSDLAAKGYAYDSVKGNLLFDKGVLLLKEPVVVESSSSKMQLAGTIDLLNEKIDSEMVATLPVAGNLAVATAFVAGLPAAVGVYVVSKLFKDQVDKASSVNYSIKGGWADPKVKINRIFDDTAAKEKGKTIERSQPRRRRDRNKNDAGSPRDIDGKSSSVSESRLQFDETLGTNDEDSINSTDENSEKN